MNISIIGHRKIFLTVSGVLVLASFVVILAFGFRSGIDFRGGTLWQISFPDGNVSQEQVTAFFRNDIGVTELTVTTERETSSFIIRLPELSPDEHTAMLGKLTTAFEDVTELRFDAIGAAVGRELRNRALTAFILVLLGISLYIAFAFRKVSRPVSSWKYGVITLVTLFHDAIIPAGLMAVLGRFGGVEVDTNFVVALLVVMGFSVHDTIVVFDRVREHLTTAGSSKMDFDGLVNVSVNQTIARSINTSLTLIFVLLALFFFGSPTLRYFILTMLVGTIAGTYSSIFVASPLVTIWRRRAVQ